MPVSLVDSRFEPFNVEQNGMARAFIRKMNAATIAAVLTMQAISDEVFTTLERRHRPLSRRYIPPATFAASEKSAFRPDYLICVERRWRSIPVLGCVGIEIQRPDKHSISPG
jgi:hypothetical protein